MTGKKFLAAALLAVILPAGCGSGDDTAGAKPTEAAAEVSKAAEPTQAPEAPEEDAAEATPTEEAPGSETPSEGLEDGVYLAAFDTDSSMFHVNEAWEGKGILTVLDGEMTIHLVMPSKNVVNLYPGTAEDAAKEGAVLIEPVNEEVTYSDGITEEVYAFDLPVPVLDEEFDCALIGTKGKWYDHRVIVSDPEAYSDVTEIADGEYSIDAYVEGGTGRASISTPAKLSISGGEIVITLEWSSPHYDYMIVDGVKYLPVNAEGNSVFEIPIENIESDISVIADTTAMSKPHEIEYVLHLDPSTLK